MSNNNQDWYDDDDLDMEDFFEEEEEAPRKPARKPEDAIKQIRRAERAKDKRVKELEAELSSLRKFQRDATVSQVLSEKGVNPKIAAFIPADLETSADAISSWLEQYGEVFGYQQQQNQNQASQQNLEALQTLSEIDGAISGAFSPDDISDSFNSISNAQSAEELLNYLYSQGVE